MQATWRPPHPAFAALIDALLDETAPIHVVGGIVRDVLMDRAGRDADVDLVVHSNALFVAKAAADRLGWAYFPLDEARDVARLVFNPDGVKPLVCDVAGMRGTSLESDLRARDFTINAMAFTLTPDAPPRLVDLFDGQGDIARNVIRTVGPTSLAEDPLRLLRAVRFAVQLDFTIDPVTEEQIRRLSGSLRSVSAERIRDELWKALAAPRPQRAMDDLRRLGLLLQTLPELYATIGVAQSYPHYLDVYDHTMLVVEHAAELRDWIAGSGEDVPEYTPGWQAVLAPWRTELRRHFLQPLAGGRRRVDWLVWHALLHDIGKPETRSQERQPNGRVVFRFFDHETVGADLAEARLDALRYSRQEIALDRAVILGHMRPHHLENSFAMQPISRRALYRFFRDTGIAQSKESAALDTWLLALADVQGTYAERPPNWSEYLAHTEQVLAYAFTDQGAADVRRRPLVDGFAVMRHLDLTPGPAIGALLAQILEAQAAGDISTPEEALALAQTLQAGGGAN
ncbi:MAG: HD domain-containing protein [Caldilineaceae bacterium]